MSAQKGSNELDRSIRYGTREGSAAFCLGHPPHAVQAEEVICPHCGALVAGVQLGVYQVQQHLGRGRSGSAYLATHIRSRQPVVIKLFPARDASAALWEAGRREVRIVTALRHSSVLPVFSCTLWHPGRLNKSGRAVHEMMSSAERGEYLLTLCQYVPGNITGFLAHYEQQEVRATTEQHPSLLARLIDLIKQLGSALSVAHERGIAHGALVPGNILVDGHNHLWLADFGLARLQPVPAPFLAPELLAVSQDSLRSGNMEMYWRAVAPSSDQYAFAVLCEQLLTRLLHSLDYEPALSVLQCATGQKPSRRFASVDIFVHELVAQLTRSHGSFGQRPAGSAMRSASGAEWSQPISSPGNRRMSSSAEWKTAYPQLTPAHRERYEQMMSYQLSASSLPPVEDWEKRGDKLFTMHDYAGAMAAYQKALEIDNGKAATWLALGDAYLALENYAEALRAYEHAMTLNPNDALAWSNRGTALDALGRHKEAMDCYERASQMR